MQMIDARGRIVEWDDPREATYDTCMCGGELAWGEDAEKQAIYDEDNRLVGTQWGLHCLACGQIEWLGWM